MDFANHENLLQILEHRFGEAKTAIETISYDLLISTLGSFSPKTICAGWASISLLAIEVSSCLKIEFR